jgi:hypothetical protein
MSKLIITTGDISDVDGFICLADYVKNTDADILFIMNYPAYFNYDYEKQNDYIIQNGFNYGLKELLKITFERYKNYYNLLGVIDIDDIKSKNDFMKAYKLISYLIVKKIFDEAKGIHKNNKLIFLDGGINSKNFISSNCIKNELILYKNYIEEFIIVKKINLNINTDNLFNKQINLNNYDKYEEIYIDMCGSVSFYKHLNFISLFEHIKERIKGFYIMGGILSNVIPQTTSITSDLSTNFRKPKQATANQYYSPNEYIKLLKFTKSNNIPIFVIPNNSILIDNDIIPHIQKLFPNHYNLLKLCKIYYNENKGRKPFDFIVSRLISNHINNPSLYSTHITHQKSYLYYDYNFGSTILTDEIINEYETLKCFEKSQDEIEFIFNFNLQNHIECFLFKINRIKYSEDNENDYSINNEPIITTVNNFFIFSGGKIKIVKRIRKYS